MNVISFPNLNLFQDWKIKNNLVEPLLFIKLPSILTEIWSFSKTKIAIYETLEIFKILFSSLIFKIYWNWSEKIVVFLP